VKQTFKIVIQKHKIRGTTKLNSKIILKI